MIVLLPRANDFVFHQLYGFGEVVIPNFASVNCYVKFEDFSELRRVPSQSLVQL